MLKEIAVKVGCCAVFGQPHGVYCNFCKSVDGTRFLRNLIKELAYRDCISLMAGTGEKKISAFLSPWSGKQLWM